MKKVIFTFTIALIFNSYLISAQSNKINIGLEGGFGGASMRGNYLSNGDNMKLGTSGGLIIQYNLKSFLSLKTGIYIENKGSSEKVQGTNQLGQNTKIFRINENFQYLSIPVLLKATFGKNKLNYFINVGPSANLLIKQIEHYDAFENIPGRTTDYTSKFKKMEYGIVGGIGVSYTLKQKFICSVELRDNLGLTSISKLPIYGSGSIKTNYLGCFLGIAYKLGS